VVYTRLAAAPLTSAERASNRLQPRITIAFLLGKEQSSF
jgi:hypothetical protein